MRESTVETYLHRQVTKAGGTTRKMKGRINDCDRLIIWPGCESIVHFCETKAPGKRPRPGQAREHARLMKLGCIVVVLDSKQRVDEYIQERLP